MNVGYDVVERFVRDEVAALTGDSPEAVTADTVLVGTGRVVDSADLVMLLLAAEDFARETLGADFDWTSDSAMSEARSVLRNVGSLARHLSQLAPSS
ncbi:MAG: acyl carrier protein [Gemmatimonadales bacterium]